MAERREAINRINVFPVADRDTGSNLAATLTRVSSALAGRREASASAVARRAADEALLGARGNSGAILAQALEGFAERLGGADRVAASAFPAAARAAADAARGAMAHPKEGTLLSVISAWASALEDSPAGADWSARFASALPAARAALARTPDQLAILRKAGVVDAGAQGFVDLLEGIASGYTGRRAPPPLAEDRVEARIRQARETLLFRWCTEVLLSGTGLDREALRRAAAPLGDSLAVVGSATRVRLHVHVNRPEDVFEVARRFGHVEETKVEDMSAQRDAAATPGSSRPPGRVAVVTDTACDLPDALLEREGIALVPLRLQIGEETFLDRVTITAAEFAARLREEGFAPRTSQPPPADFREVYGALAAHGPVVGIHVSGALSGTFSAARLAARGLREEPRLSPVEAFDSRAVSVAQGLVVRAAARAAVSGAGLAEVVRAAEDAARRVRLLAAVPSLDALVRGGRVTEGQRRLANLLGVVPLLTLDREGRARAGGAARGFPRACLKLVAKTLETARDAAEPIFGVAHVGAPELADRIAEDLLARRPGAEGFVVEVTPVLAAHAGPGAVAVATLGREPR